MEANPITMRANGFKVAGQQYKDMFYALRRIELMERDEERKAVEELRNELLRNHSQPWAGYNALCLMQYISESKATVLHDGLSNFAKASLWQYLEKLATKSKDTYSDYLTSKSKIEKRWGEWDTHEFLRRAPASGKGHIQALETFCMGVKADYAKAFINRQVYEHASKGVEAEDPTDRFEHQTKYMHAFFRLSKMPRRSDLLLKDSELESVCGVIDSDGFLVYDEAKGKEGIQGKGDTHQTTKSTPLQPAPKNEETIEHQSPDGLNGTTAAAAEDAVKAEPTDEDQDIDLCEDAPIQVAGVQAIDNAHQNTNGTGSAERHSTEATSSDSSESEEVQSDSSDQGQDDQSDNDHDGSNTNDGGDETPNDNGQASYHRQCLPCRYRHASCDKGQPTCSQCIKHYGKDNRTHLCTYYYPSLTMPVVVPEEYKVRGIIRRRRKPNAGLSVNTNTDEATASTSRSGTKSAPPTTEPGSATSPGLNQQGNWKRWQRLQIIRLRGILMHCLERDAGIKIDIPNTEYDFFLASFATNNGFTTVAPQEFLELFELKIWRWKRQIMSAIPLLIKDGIICFVKAGEQKNKKIPFFIRDYYLRETEKDKDGWEDIFGPKPLMEDMRQQQLLSQGANAAVAAKAEKTPNTTGKKRTRKPRKSVFDGIEGLDDERKRKNPRTGGSGAWQPSQTANSAPQEYDSDSDDNIIPPAFTASQPRPTAYSTTFRPPSASNNGPTTAPSESPLTRTPSQSHTPSAISTDGPTSVKDIIEGLKNDITDLQKLANSTNNALIKETARDECERLKMQCVEMKEWEAAEREVESNVSLSDAVRKMMKGALVRKALGRRSGG